MSRKLIDSVKASASMLLALWTGSAAHAAPFDEVVSIETFRTHTRIIFQMDRDISPVVASNRFGFEITLPKTTLIDIGIPFGLEKNWMARQEKRLRDLRVKEMEITEFRDRVVFRAKWRFAKGLDAPANPEIVNYTFRKEEPSRYVIDIWLKEGLTVRQMKKIKIQRAKLAILQKSQEEAQLKTDRRIATRRKRTRNTDPSKFCRLPLSESRDIFLHFGAVNQRVDFSQWFDLTAPDRDYPYLEPRTNTKEANYVRMALKFYREGKHALAVRVIDFFRNDYPKSPFGYEMKFLEANAFNKLGLQERAHQIFEDLLVEEKGTPVALHARMFLAGRAFMKLEYLKAMEHFFALIRDYPNHRLSWVFHLGIAESLSSIKQTERAAKEYRWVVENAPNPRARAHSAVRIGNLYLERKQYAQALAAYYKATKHFKEETKDIAELYINRAEALYWLGQHTRSEREFLKVIERFPNRPGAWRAAYRLSDITGRRAPRIDNEPYRKWLYHTVNRYPYTPGMMLAHMGIFQCDTKHNFNVSTIQRFFEVELKNFDGGGVLSEIEYPDFITLAYARALASLDHPDLAIEVIGKRLGSQRSRIARSAMSDILKLALRTHTLRLLSEGKRFEAISFFKRYWKRVANDKSELEPDFLLKLSMAAADLKLGATAVSIFESYSDLSRIMGTSAIITADIDRLDFDGQLEASMRNYAHAKALWTAYGPEAGDRITKLLDNVVDESPHSFEAKMIYGLIEEHDENYENALRYAVQSRLLLPEKYRSVDRGLRAWIGRLQAKAGNRMAGVYLYRKLREDMAMDADRIPAQVKVVPSIKGIPPAPTLSLLYQMEGELLEKEGLWGQAAIAYSEAIEKGEKSNEVSYAFARALERMGDNKRAKDVLTEILNSKTEDFWKRMAQEALENREVLKN